MWNDRTKLLVGQDGIDKLEKASVAVIGIGGVGGYVCHMLARAGIGHITIVDFDKVDETNINRQVVANSKTIGKLKTEVMKNQLLEINPNCEITTFSNRFNADFAKKFFEVKFDYIVDAIDSVSDKVELICECVSREIPIVSAMGAGNRKDIPNFKVVDIYKTFNDGLAKVMRKKLRERGVKKLDVVTCETPAEKIDKRQSSVGSIAYYPAMCGCVLSAFVINQITK